MTMEHFYLSIKNTQRKIEDVRNLFKNLTTREKEILEFEKVRAERLKIERELGSGSNANRIESQTHSSLSSASPSPSSPQRRAASRTPESGLGAKTGKNGTTPGAPPDRPMLRRSQEIIIVENIKRPRGTDNSAGRLSVSGRRGVQPPPHALSSRHSTGNAVDTTANTSSFNCLDASRHTSNENFQMIQKSEIINFNKLNQLNSHAAKQASHLLASKRRERDEEANADVTKIHRRGSMKLLSENTNFGMETSQPQKTTHHRHRHHEKERRSHHHHHHHHHHHQPAQSTATPGSPGKASSRHSSRQRSVAPPPYFMDETVGAPSPVYKNEQRKSIMALQAKLNSLFDAEPDPNVNLSFHHRHHHHHHHHSHHHGQSQANTPHVHHKRYSNYF